MENGLHRLQDTNDEFLECLGVLKKSLTMYPPDPWEQ